MSKQIKRKNENKRLWQKTSLAKAVSAGIMASFITSPMLAADEEDNEVIIVTATKSSESIQTVPLAITALSGEFIQDVHLQSTKDLISYTPGITGKSDGGFLDSVAIRGIRTQDFGVGGDSSAGFFKNDLYEGRNGSVISSFYDMDRAEIARGPQGFLFGRNAVAGVVSVHTRRAEIDVDEGFIDIDVAENSRFQASGAVNIPVNDNFAMRVAGIYNTEDSFIKNVFPTDDAQVPDTETKAVRWSTTYEKDDLNIYTMVEYEDRKGHGSSYRAVESGDPWEFFEAVYGDITIADDDPYAVNQDNGFGGPQDNSSALNLQLRVEKEMEFADLTVTAGYKDHDYYYSEDYDGTPLRLADWDLTQSGDYGQVEARLSSNGDGPLSWYAGASYYKENLETAFDSRNNEELICNMYSYMYWGLEDAGCSDYNDYLNYYYGYSSNWTPSADGYLHEPNNVTGKFSGWATYLNLNYQITDDINVEFGVRHTSDNKYFTQNVPAPKPDADNPYFPCWYFCYSTEPGNPVTRELTWSNTSFKLLGRYQIDDDMMMFISWTEGYKSGGFNTFLMEYDENDNPVIPSFEPETVDSYEIGFKDTWFDGDVRVDFNIFSYESVGAQILIANPNGPGDLVLNTNTDGEGFEGTVNATLSENWNVFFTTAYLSTSVTNLGNECGFSDPNDCEGSPVFWSPTWTNSIVLDGDYPLESGASIGVSLEAHHEGNRGRGWQNTEESNIPASVWTGIRVSYESNSDSDWYVEFYVDNLLDERTWAGMNNGAGVYPTQFWGPSKPRTTGVRFGRTWGD